MLQIAFELPISYVKMLTCSKQAARFFLETEQLKGNLKHYIGHIACKTLI